MEQVNITITESAYTDLLDIELYISQDSEFIARNFINKIFDNIDQLYNYPTSGKFVPEINNKPIRELLLNNIGSYTRLSMIPISILSELFMVQDCLILRYRLI